MSKGTETKSRSDHAWAFWTARALAILLILGGASIMQSSPPTPDPEPDLDVDSDNSNWPGGWPDRSQYEDDIEDISNDPQYPGKFIMVNDNDDDGDGIPDFADGFNWDEQSGNDDDANWYESDLVPIVLELPDAIDLAPWGHSAVGSGLD